MRRSSFSAGAISDQSAPIRSQSSASVLATVTEATRQQLIEIFVSSALSKRIGRIGQPKACEIASPGPAGNGCAGSAQPTIKRSGCVARSTARPKTSVSTW